MTANALTDTLRETLAVFDESPPGTPLTTSEVADRLDVGRRSTYERLDRLVELERLRTKKVGARGRVWWRVPADASLGRPRDGEERGRKRELERYRTIAETVEDGVCVLDDEYRFTHVNDAYVEMTGYDREDLLGAHCSLVVDDAVFRAVADRSRAMADEAGEDDHECATIEAELLRADGSRLAAESKFAPLPTEDGSFAGSVGVVRDVSERRARERELNRYETIVETAGDVIYVMDEEQRFTMVNRAAEELSGYPREEILGTHVGEFVGEDAADGALELVEALDERDQRDVVAAEFTLTAADGREIPVDARFTRLPTADGREERVGVARDVSDREGRERALEESERRYRTLVDSFPNGAVALFDEELRYLTVGGEIFDGLGFSGDELEGETMVERVPSELCEVLEPRYRSVFDGEASEFEVEFEDQIRHFQVSPVTDDEGTVFAGMATTQDVTERVERERTLERQRDRLTALNALNDVFRNITDAVVEQSTREEIEANVCRRLADSDAYLFAWVGDVDVQTQTVNLRTEAGVEGYLDGVTISVDPDDERSEGPTGRAIRRREVQVTQNVRTDSNYEPWSDHVDEHEFASSAAIPIVHEETLYGVLNVYAARPNAFTADERTVVGQLGEVVGHAIAAVERKRALMSDEVVELTFTMRDVFETVDVPVTVDGTVRLERTVHVDEGTFLVYGTATGDALRAVEAVVESDSLAHWESVTALRSNAAETSFELTLTEPPVLSMVAAHGGYVQEARIEDGDYYMRVHLAPSVDVRTVVAGINDAYPALELVTQRQVAHERRSPTRLGGVLYEELTDRQRVALEAAFQTGYFTWPRETTGEEIAESLGVSPPTFHQHLRMAEAKLFTALFGGDAATG